MTVETRSTLKSGKDSTLADNNTGNISAQDLRDELEDMIDSMLLREDLLDEDNMSSDSDTLPPTQQSVKTYVDSGTATLTNKTIDADNNTLSNISNDEIKTDAAIALSKLADVAEGILGRASGEGSGEAGTLTSAQATAILNLATSALKGLMPALSNNSGEFLNGVGGWSVPSGSANADSLTTTEAVVAADYIKFGNTSDTGADYGRLISQFITDLALVTLTGSDTLTNKTIDASSNTLTNVGDSALATGIDAAKIADGSVSNTEFQYLDGVTSDIQTQLDSKTTSVVDDTSPQLGGNLDVNGNSIVSTSNGDITLAPNGTGDVVLGTTTLDADQTVGAGQDQYVLTYSDAAGKAVWQANPGASGGDAWGDAVDADIQFDADGTRSIGTPSARAQSVSSDEFELEGLSLTNASGQLSVDLDPVLTEGGGTAITDKPSPVINDKLLIVDSQDSDSVKETDATNFGVGREVVTVCLFDSSETVTTGNAAGDQIFRVPSKLDGWNLVEVAAYVETAGTTGTTDIQIHNVTDAVDMLTTVITIDSGETDTSTAATAAVIDTTNDDVSTGDKIRFDVDAISTTAPTGCWVEMTFGMV